jgi:CheY-like chemotaxis protein
VTTIVICASVDLEPELSHTLFWRDDLERYVAERADEARMLVLSTEPHVVVVDRDLPGATELVASLRRQTLPHPISIVALSHVATGAGDEEAASGVDAVLSLPASPDWDARLDQVLSVPTRKQERFDVRFEIETLLRHEPVGRAGLALNMSAGGVLVECAGLGLVPGDDVDLRLPIPGLSAAVKGRARVVRNPVAEHLGLRFEAFTGDGDVRVREFLARLSRQA